MHGVTSSTDARSAAVLTLLVACSVGTVFKRAILPLPGFTQPSAQLWFYRAGTWLGMVCACADAWLLAAVLPAGGL